MVIAFKLPTFSTAKLNLTIKEGVHYKRHLPESVGLVSVIRSVEDSKLSVAQDGDHDAIGVSVIVV